MALRLSDLERKKIKRLYNKGLSILNISYELNRNKNTIKKYAIIVAKNIQVIEKIKDFVVILVEKNIVQKKKEDQR